MIVCVGTTPVYQRSMVFERLRLDEVNRAVAVHDYASGKSINVARVLHALGEEVLATGFVGSGPRGDELLADLKSAGIRHDFVRAATPARQCVTLIDRAGGTATELVEESQPVPEDDWPELIEKLMKIMPAAGAAVLSGSLPPEAWEGFYGASRRLLGRRVPVVIDARNEPLRAALQEGDFIAKLNREELGQTVGAPVDTDDAVRRAASCVLPAGGAAVITLGPSGALAINESAAWRIHAPKVPARSAVGSGDAFAAGLIAGLVRGDSFPDACGFGAACGAANAMTDLAGHLLLEDVESIRARVRLEPL